MSDLIVFKGSNRVAISVLQDKNAMSVLMETFTICSQMIGNVLSKYDNNVLCTDILPILKKDYGKYDISEISQILKDGFAKYGIHYKNVCTSACCDILRKWEENPYNKEQLQKNIDISENLKRGEETEEEKRYNELKTRIIGFENAKKMYLEDNVTTDNIFFSFSNCYLYVKENLKDESIIISKEDGLKLLDEVKDFYNQRFSEDNNDKNLYLTLLKACPKEIMIKTMFRSVLFHYWALTNFQINIDAIPLKSAQSAQLETEDKIPF